MRDEFLYPLIGAVIAAATSLVVSILSKDQKTSEFRQAWIDAFREDAANLAGHWSTIIAALDAKKAANEDTKLFLASLHSDITNIEVRIARMRLRLNPKEHAHLIRLLQGMASSTPRTRAEMDHAIEAVVLEVQKVLRIEWKRVKRGEWSFRMLKLVSLIAIIGGGGWYYFQAAPV